MTIIPFENRNYAFAGTFVEELACCGLKHVCICPGSRSSPLAISFARQKEIKKWVHLDERSAAFFALGIARYTNEPAAVVCSSGTAAANFSPAVIEAYYSGVPLLVLTADRPAELHGWGALQTIDQSNLFASHSKWTAELPPPEITPSLLNFVRAAACRAFITACEIPAGPVHLNFPFREPLEPSLVAADFPAGISALEACSTRGQKGAGQHLSCVNPVSSPSQQAIKALALEITGKRGLIVCGPVCGEDIGESVSLLARRLDFPVLADCLSQVRCGKHDLSYMIDNYDLFLDNTEMAAPEVIIRFGAVPVSKPLASYMEKHSQARQIFIDPPARWRNPAHTAAELWRVKGEEFCLSLSTASKGNRRTANWSGSWIRASLRISAAAQEELASCEELFEGKIFSELAKVLPENSTVFTGNSMPIRDMDTFFPSTGTSVRFMANRGASGIDGVISTALGASAAARGRLVLVLGDVSFYHDMNGLLAAKAFKLNATIIVINNNGGGIFSFLPQSAYKGVFETYFGTPHGLTFEPAARLYGLDYALAGNWTSFNSSVKKSLNRKGVTIIEVPGDRQRNLTLHREIRNKILSRFSGKGRKR